MTNTPITAEQQAALTELHEYRTIAEDRDNRVIRAHHTDLPPAEISRTSGLALNTVKKIINDYPRRAAAAPAATHDDPLAGHHHPHYIATKITPTGRRYQFWPFTGTEPAPQLPAGVDRLDPELRDLINEEYNAAREQHATAKFLLHATPAIHAANVNWDQYQKATRAMRAAFRSLLATPDNHWLSAMSRLTTNQQTALKAAREWDHTAATLQNLLHSVYVPAAGQNLRYPQEVLADYPWVDAWVESIRQTLGMLSTDEAGAAYRHVESEIRRQKNHVQQVTHTARAHEPESHEEAN